MRPLRTMSGFAGWRSTARKNSGTMSPMSMSWLILLVDPTSGGGLPRAKPRPAHKTLLEVYARHPEASRAELIEQTSIVCFFFFKQKTAYEMDDVARLATHS